MSVIVLIASYLIGSLPMAYVVGRYFKGIDIRQVGSGTVGTTNVFRTLGPMPALLVLVGDVGKGVVSVLWAGAVGGPTLAVLAGILAMAGHNWSIFLRFHGGRGVATGLGVFLALTPAVALVGLAIFVALVAIPRYVSLGSIIAAAAVPVLMVLFAQPVTHVLFGLLAAALIVYRHRPNIQRLLSGTESKLGQRIGK